MKFLLSDIQFLLRKDIQFLQHEANLKFRLALIQFSLRPFNFLLTEILFLSLNRTKKINMS